MQLHLHILEHWHMRIDIVKLYFSILLATPSHRLIYSARHINVNIPTLSISPKVTVIVNVKVIQPCYPLSFKNTTLHPLLLQHLLQLHTSTVNQFIPLLHALRQCKPLHLQLHRHLHQLLLWQPLHPTEADTRHRLLHCQAIENAPLCSRRHER